MKKQQFAALALTAVLGASCLTGCELVTTNNQRDMEQIVAEVDISKSEEFRSGGEYADYADIIGVETVNKRDLVAYFINVGYVYVQSYGYTYSQTFDLMLDSLVNQKIVSEYAKVYYLELSKTSEDYDFTLSDYLAYVDAAEDKEIAAYRYFLTDEEYRHAIYSLKSTINDALDSYEHTILEANHDDEASDVTVRTLPTGLNTQKEDYFDPDYEIYTGRNAASACGSYETQDGSTPTTRKKAYNNFLKNLGNNYLYREDERGLPLEETAYYRTELLSQLVSSLVSKLADTLEDEAAKTLTKEYVTARYNELLESQKRSFDASSSTFETALDGLSDTSFALYAPDDGFGFVINILLPFSATQSYQLKTVQSDTSLTQDEQYQKRATLLRNVRATDQRDSWFLGEEDYSFESETAYGGKGYLFFEDALSGEGEYEKLEKYYGQYPYNGKVEQDEDGEYTLTPEKISIDDFIDVFEGYVSYASGVTPQTIQPVDAAYYDRSFVHADGTVDYANFVYYAGKFDVGFHPDELFVADTAAYLAFSAVNELSFAYNTDTAGLNGYLGYTVSAYDTSYVKEFEYAAKYAVSEGVGTYVVAPSDYGWHVMYCTYTFGEGELYSFDYADIEREGTFSYYFYEALKSSTSGTASNAWESRIVNLFNNETCVTDYESRYRDLKDLDNR